MTGDELRTAEAAVQELLARVPDGSAAVPLLATDVTGVAHHPAPSRGSARACEG